MAMIMRKERMTATAMAQSGMAQMACPFADVASVPEVHLTGIGFHPHGGQAEAGNLSGHADALVLRFVGQREALAQL